MKDDSLKRIANALEEIASLLRERPARQPAAADANRDELLGLLMANASKLIGKMDMAEISIAIGIRMDPTKRRAMGSALRAYGAVKGMSKNKAYYLFPGTERKARETNADPGREVLRLEAFAERLRTSRQALSGHMTPKQIISALGFKRMPGDEVSLAAALSEVGIGYTVRDDIFIFD